MNEVANFKQKRQHGFLFNVARRFPLERPSIQSFLLRSLKHLCDAIRVTTRPGIVLPRNASLPLDSTVVAVPAQPRIAQLAAAMKDIADPVAHETEGADAVEESPVLALHDLCRRSVVHTLVHVAIGTDFIAGLDSPCAISVMCTEAVDIVALAVAPEAI